MSQSALVRGDDGGLHVRTFPTAAGAREASAVRDIVLGRADWTPAKLAKLVGVSKRTISRRCEDGLLPFIDQGTPAKPRYFLSAETVRLVRIHGLAGVAAMRQAGQL